MVDPVYSGGSSPSLFAHVTCGSADTSRADQLVTAYGYLCRRGARKFWRAGLERCDLEQVAAIGLIKAARRFDHASRTPFEAYAWLMIVSELMHHVRDHERMVRIPRRLKTLEAKFTRARETVVARLGREPRDSELAEEMGVVEQIVVEVRSAAACATIVSLEEPAARGIAGQANIDAEDRFLVADGFAKLSVVEQRVIVGIYVLGISQQELARTLGIAPRRVSRVRSSALLSMRRSWAS